MSKKIFIIGAGMAGLSTGCYAQMNDFDSKIFEMHTSPGGVCTSWNRKGYRINGCIHWLTGSAPGNNFHSIWKELGVVPNLQMVYFDEYARIEGQDGKTLRVFTDVDRLEAQMKELAAEDTRIIEEFTNGIRKAIDFPMPVEKAPELYGPLDGLRMAMLMSPYARFLAKWGKVSLQDFAQRFNNPFLRETFPHIFNLQNSPDFPMMPVLMTLGWMHQKTAGYPLGGSQKLAETLERRYTDQGGEIRYGSRVEKILVEGDRAVGVRLADGSEHHADIVVSAADGHTTIYDMLDGKYLDRKTQGYYERLPLYPPLVYVNLGVSRLFDDPPDSVTGTSFPLKEPINIGGQVKHRMGIQAYSFDPTSAPDGKTLLKTMFASDYDYWKNLSSDQEAYKAEKKSVETQVIKALDERYPGLAGQVEMIDVATPVTWERYTGNWRGSFQGWLETNETLTMRMSKTLPNLKGFYMAGQWVEPGGSIPTAVMSGRNTIQIICNSLKKKFEKCR